MVKTEVLLDFNSKITFRSIDLMLAKFKESNEFKAIEKPTRKRIYSILVECAENIYKYSSQNISETVSKRELPKISVKKQGDNYIIESGNLISNQSIEKLSNRLNEVNQLGPEGLKELYEKVINKEHDLGKNGAGLGLITIALKANSKINYKVITINERYSYIEMQVKIY